MPFGGLDLRLRGEDPDGLSDGHRRYVRSGVEGVLEWSGRTRLVIGGFCVGFWYRVFRWFEFLGEDSPWLEVEPIGTSIFSFLMNIPKKHFQHFSPTVYILVPAFQKHFEDFFTQNFLWFFQVPHRSYTLHSPAFQVLSIHRGAPIEAHDITLRWESVPTLLQMKSSTAEAVCFFTWLGKNERGPPAVGIRGEVKWQW